MLNNGSLDLGAATSLLGVKPIAEDPSSNQKGGQGDADFVQVWGAQDETTDAPILLAPFTAESPRHQLAQSVPIAHAETHLRTTPFEDITDAPKIDGAALAAPLPPAIPVTVPVQGPSNQGGAIGKEVVKTQTEPPVQAVGATEIQPLPKGDGMTFLARTSAIPTREIAPPTSPHPVGPLTGSANQSQPLPTASLPQSNEVRVQSTVRASLPEPPGGEIMRSTGPRSARSGTTPQSPQNTSENASDVTAVPPVLFQTGETGQTGIDPAERPAPEPLVAQVQSGTGPQTRQSATAPLPGSYAPKIAAQLVATAVRSGAGTTQITLNPEELGRVRMTLTTTEHGIAVAIAAERPETVDLMRRHVDLLIKEFEDLDQGDVAFRFGENDTDSGETEPHSEETNIFEQDQVTADPTPRHIPTTAQTSGLDLKL